MAFPSLNPKPGSRMGLSLLLCHLPAVAVHHQRILSRLAMREGGAYRGKGCLHLLGLGPGRNVGEGVMVVDLRRLQTGTVDAGGKAIDGIDSPVAKTEV